MTTAEGLDQFERASWVGFEENEEMLASRPSHSWHPVATLENPNMFYWVAWLEGKVVAGVIAHATDDMLGIYGLSTLLPYRRRGYATALIRAAVAARPDLSACVFPDPPSVPIYTQIGFAPAGEIAIWRRKV
ncbi:MAG: GNAT family N-acetyltransferase [Caldilineaceae bacterium]